MKAKVWPDKKAFKAVYIKVIGGEKLTLEDVGDVFGPEFLVMQIYMLMDSQDAARAIQGAVNRLKAGE